MTPETDQDVDRYEWLQAIFSEHGPTSHSERSILGAIYCHTSAKRGSAWPSQATIAKRALLSERQVKRVLAKLADQGWLRRELARRGGGKGWKMTVYWPSLPQALYEAGVVKRHEHVGDRKRGRGDTQMSPPNARSRATRAAEIEANERVIPELNRPVIEDDPEALRKLLKATARERLKSTMGTPKPMVGTSEPVGGDICRVGGDISLPIVVTPGCPMNPPSESINGSPHTSEGAQALASSPLPHGGVCRNLTEGKSPEPMPKTQAGDEISKRVRTLLKAFPSDSDESIAKIGRLDVSAVRQVRRAAP